MGFRRRWISALCFFVTDISLAFAYGQGRLPTISEEFGSSPFLSLFLSQKTRNGARAPFFFDPLEIATEDNFVRLREAELKHGRVAMMASAEIMIMPLFRPSQQDETTDLTQKIVAWSTQPVLPRWSESLSATNIVILVSVCLLLETLVFVQRQEQDMPGDYGTGFFGVRDKGKNEEFLLVELEHGRLAMLAFVFRIVSEVSFDWRDILDAWRAEEWLLF